MKTKTYAESYCMTRYRGGRETGWTSITIPATMLPAQEIQNIYYNQRINGNDADSPHTPFPRSGIISSASEDRTTHNCGTGLVTRYDESQGDKAWMEERDRNYVFRLLREGTLDRDEPKLATEVPALYAEVVWARELLAKEADFPSVENLEDIIAANQTIDLKTLAEEITKQYEQLRQNAQAEKTEIVKRLVPQVPLDLNQINTKLLQILLQNQSVKTLNIANTNLSAYVRGKPGYVYKIVKNSYFG